MWSLCSSQVSGLTDFERLQVWQAAASQERVVDEIRLIGVPVEVQRPDRLLAGDDLGVGAVVEVLVAQAVEDPSCVGEGRPRPRVPSDVVVEVADHQVGGLQKPVLRFEHFVRSPVLVAAEGSALVHCPDAKKPEIDAVKCDRDEPLDVEDGSDPAAELRSREDREPAAAVGADPGEPLEGPDALDVARALADHRDVRLQGEQGSGLAIQRFVAVPGDDPGHGWRRLLC